MSYVVVVRSEKSGEIERRNYNKDCVSVKRERAREKNIKSLNPRVRVTKKSWKWLEEIIGRERERDFVPKK